jgi:hypothetical protein
MTFSALSSKQQFNSNRRTVFCELSVSRYYRHEKTDAKNNPSSRQRGRYKVTKPQMTKENVKEKEKLIAGPGWAPDTKTDWPTVCRSYCDFDFDPGINLCGGGL